MSQKKEDPHDEKKEDLCTKQITVEGDKAHGMCGSETVYGKAVVTGDNVVFKQDSSKSKLQSIDGTKVELDSH